MLKKLFLSLLVVLGASVVSFAAATTYCTPNFTYGTLDGDYVARVLLTGNDFTLDNVTVGAGGSPAYTHYTTWTTLSWGQAYSITVRVGTYPTRQWVAAWIDYNGNGTFETAERLGMTVNSITANSFVTFNFTVPTVGASGVTRMRVIEETYVTSIDPCTITDIYGETEDYDITLVWMIAALVGGQGYKKIPTDLCPDGDFSPTPYDGLCAGQSLTNGGVPAWEKKTDTTTGSVSNTGISLLSGVVLDTWTISTGETIGSGEATGVNMLPVEEPIIVGICLDKEQQGKGYSLLHHVMRLLLKQIV